MTTAGTLSSHVLAKQVLSRFSTEKQMRSTMLAALARQVERYRDLHLAWQEQRSAARDVVVKAEKEVLARDKELVAEKKRSEQEIEKYRSRLGAVYRGLQKELDELREQKHGLENQLQESLQREREQTAMIESLESRNKALRLTLDKTVQKLNDVQSQRADAEKKSAALQNVQGRVEQAPELQSALQQIDVLAASRDRAEEEAAAARTGMLRLQNEVQRERALAAYYENFVRKVATGPEACVRTGGGYLVDSRAKAEAAALLRESAAFARQAALYPSDGSYPPSAEFGSLEQGSDLGGPGPPSSLGLAQPMA
jgi:chromosome segregation ATPase